MGQSSSQRQIYLSIEAGETQSLQLFDFNSQDNKVITHQLITNNSQICHDGENITYSHIKDENQPLYTLNFDQKTLQLQTHPGNDKYLWRVLKPGELFPLNPGTYIKLGKVKLRLKEVVEEEKEKTERDNSNSLHHDLLEVKSISVKSEGNASTQEKLCRICFEGCNSLDNPLVSLCKCMGTVKYIHFECLKDWVSKNVVKREQNNTLFYSYQEPKCEICQKYYQAEFTYEGKKYSLLDMDRAPNPPYAIFEGIDFEDQSRRFSVFLIGLGEDEITIGRNSNSNMVMKQISVSRSHCTLLYKGRQLLIRDKGSKFGTLIKIEDEMQFSPIEGISFQYESKLLTIRQEGKLNCCCAESDTFLLKIKHDHSDDVYFQDQD